MTGPSSGTATPGQCLRRYHLNAHRDDVLLENLDPPSGGHQSLVGSFINITQVEGADVAPPTESTGARFPAPAAPDKRLHISVSRYFMSDQVFPSPSQSRFDFPTYFANTTFPSTIWISAVLTTSMPIASRIGMGGIGHSAMG